MKVQKKINTTPREKLNFSTPKEEFSIFVCNIALASWLFNAVSDIVDEKVNSLSEKILQLFKSLNADKEKFKELGISFEEKAFYDVLVNVRDTHGFEYDDERCIELAKKIKLLVDDVTIYADFANNNNLKS